MNKIIGLALAAGLAVAGFATTASAREGCGPGFHRGYYGHCRPNRGERIVLGPDRLIIGHFYTGRGYWDGHRYWHNRVRWHRGWRYRD